MRRRSKDIRHDGISWAKYVAAHYWLRRRFGSAKECEHCHLEGLKYQYALKRGLYHDKNRSNYLTLCISCHRIYDALTLHVKKIASLRRKKVYQYTLSGDFVKEHGGLIEAANTMKVHKTSIRAAIVGKTKTSAGFNWSYTKLNATT